MFLGYTEGTKAYRLYDPRGDKVSVSRNIVFNEEAAWDWHSPSTGEAGGFTNTFVVENFVIHGSGDVGEEVPTTPAIEPSTPRVVPSTPRGVPSTLGVMPRGPTVVSTTPGWVPNTPVAEPRSLAVMPTTPRLGLSTPVVVPNTLGVVTSGLGECQALQPGCRALQVRCRSLRRNRELHQHRSSSPHLQVTSPSSWMPSTTVRRYGSAS